MTIAAGFACHDGIVLGADRLFTSGVSTRAQKLFLARYRPDPNKAVWAVAGSGFDDDLRHVRRLVHQQIRGHHDFDGMTEAIGSALIEYVDKHIIPLGEAVHWVDHPRFLFAIKSGERAELWTARGGDVLNSL
jgi:hypothetical protein